MPMPCKQTVKKIAEKDLTDYLSFLSDLVLEFVNTVMYAEAILDAGGGGRVVPGLSALGDSTNAAQRQKRSVP